jgi:hypothetical protein
LSCNYIKTTNFIFGTVCKENLSIYFEKIFLQLFIGLFAFIERVLRLNFKKKRTLRFSGSQTTNKTEKLVNIF